MKLKLWDNFEKMMRGVSKYQSNSSLLLFGPIIRFITLDWYFWTPPSFFLKSDFCPITASIALINENFGEISKMMGGVQKYQSN